MIASAWRRVGITPAALVVTAMAAVAFVLSRTSGSGWLVVMSAALVAVLIFAAVWSLVGMVGLAVTLELPTDATVGDTLAVRATVRAPFRQLRLLQLRGLDASTHPIAGSGAGTLRVHAPRRQLVTELELDVATGLPLGLITPRRRFRVHPDPPLAVAPLPAPVSLVHALQQDDSASVRGLRSYVRGDAARLVHWRSSARHGELMVREFETDEPLRGTHLSLRLDLGAGGDPGEAAAAQATGLANAALDAGMQVELLTAEASGPRAGTARSRRDVGRRIAAATIGTPPSPARADHIIELRAPGSA